MKTKILFPLVVVSCMLLKSVTAQVTTSFRLDADGEDATVTTFHPTAPYDSSLTDYCSGAWTISGTEVIYRNFFRFDLSGIPSNAIIQSASLSLFYSHNNSFGPAPHSSLTNSDQSLLQRVTSAWTEKTVTWNTQPSVTTSGQVILPQSTSDTQNYLNMDVTAMVQQMVISPNANFGFLLRLNNEMKYARLIFGSGDNPDVSNHPVLSVTYTTVDLNCAQLRIDNTGEDATITTYYPTTPYDSSMIDYCSGAWTISGTQVLYRNLFKFDLTNIPSNAIIQNASLSLFYSSNNGFGPALHSSLTNSDQSLLQRVTSGWTEKTVTWNTQPTTTTTDQVILPQSTSGTQDYPNMDVTAMVQQMIGSPGANRGFLLRLTTETQYARLIFASGDYPDVSKHPTLQVCYLTPSTSTEITLNLKVFLQGFYRGNRLLVADVNPVKYPFLCDSITVELHRSTFPYALAESARGTISSSGKGSFVFSPATAGNSYFIVVRTRNCMATWSKNAVLFNSSIMNFDFTSP